MSTQLRIPASLLLCLGLMAFGSGCGIGTDILLNEIQEEFENGDNPPPVAGDALLAIDLANGDRSYVASPFTGAGPSIQDPRAVAVDAAGDRALVWDETRGAILSVDLDTRDRSVLSGLLTGSGPNLTAVRALAVDAGRDRLIAADAVAAAPALFTVDLATGDRALLGGTGPGLAHPSSLAIDAAGDRALLGDSDLNAVFVVDLATGNRTTLSDGATGSGPMFVSLVALAMDTTGNRLLLLDATLEALFAIDLATGDRTVLSGTATGSGPLMDAASALAFDAAAPRALVALPHPGPEMLLAVDLTTGDRTLLSGTKDGDGPRLGRPADLTLDPARPRVLVVNRALP